MRPTEREARGRLEEAHADEVAGPSNESDQSFDVGEEVEVQNAGNGITVLAYSDRSGILPAVSGTLAYDESTSGCEIAGTAHGF